MILDEKTLEIAAREYCRRLGLDADEHIPISPAPNPNGSVNMVYMTTPRWRALAYELQQVHQANEALRYAINQTNSS